MSFVFLSATTDGLKALEFSGLTMNCLKSTFCHHQAARETVGTHLTQETLCIPLSGKRRPEGKTRSNSGNVCCSCFVFGLLGFVFTLFSSWLAVFGLQAAKAELAEHWELRLSFSPLSLKSCILLPGLSLHQERTV